SGRARAADYQAKAAEWPAVWPSELYRVRPLLVAIQPGRSIFTTGRPRGVSTWWGPTSTTLQRHPAQLSTWWRAGQPNQTLL
ncbi:unnamed protein product, partial [Amoebophrya sp. A120]